MCVNDVNAHVPALTITGGATVAELLFGDEACAFRHANAGARPGLKFALCV